MKVRNVLHVAHWQCRTQKSPKFAICAAHHRITLSGCIFATKTHIDNRKKNLLNSNKSYLLHISSQYDERWPTNGWDRFTNFNGFRVLASLLQQRLSPKANQTLHVFWPSPAGWYTIYIYTFSGALATWRNFARCKIHFRLRPNLAFFYIGSITAQQSSSGRQPNFVAW